LESLQSIQDFLLAPIKDKLINLLLRRFNVSQICQDFSSNARRLSSSIATVSAAGHLCQHCSSCHTHYTSTQVLVSTQWCLLWRSLSLCLLCVHAFLRILWVLSFLLFNQFCVIKSSLLQAKFNFLLFLPIILYFSLCLSTCYSFFYSLRFNSSVYIA
jgi:hypothetical protein